MENTSYYKRIGMGVFALFLILTLTACFRNTQPYQPPEDYSPIIDERENDQDEVSEVDDQDENSQDDAVNGTGNGQTQAPKEYPSIAQEVSWRNYQNNSFGYKLSYPAIANIIGNDLDQKVEFVGPMEEDEENWPRLSITHYNSSFYRPPLGTDVKEWVKMFSGYELGEDRIIAGLSALHFVQPRSPQAYGANYYYFIKGNQLFLITLLHSNDRQDWPLYDKFLDSLEFAEDLGEPENLTYCQSDADCVPMPGCHPRQCINAEFADNYTQPEVCTQLFDCQAAYKAEDCLCVNNVCANANLGNQCFDQ